VRPRLYLDEDVTPDLAPMLRDGGYDAISVHEIGAAGLSDLEQLERASGEGRVLLTYNYRDFLHMSEEWSRAGRSHAGVVISYRQYARHEIGTLYRKTVDLVETLSGDVLRDTVVVLDQFGRRG
jgi:predicted nuclease of predicted toxin-antitoxin system